ncbi:putative Tetratricopeptide repeat domain protein [Planktothrix sp. PCC 11201]|uniref:serine/threonine-protein kinase n=1 Tax=Planktothrix sp. PCC 11201 TaxID=1729650 RepID=UPI00090F59FE|nr:serine/threonine-protein kinase [Planktothrix sp. PCC 11201]SKB16152.1 putative Tetratricopeptide repeat domain protein [Planktothrix sp. PCC 11201]
MEIGQIINHRYQVICLLGTGGFGEVWEVYDLQDQEHKVLKILQQHKFQYYPEKDQNKIISLFKQEAKVLQKLAHPGIPKGYDYFTITPEGYLTPLHCLVMEKVTGENLQQWLEKNQKIPNIIIALNWLKQLTKTIAIIHQEKLIHRDIKPENIILKSDGTLVLIDFGAVRQMTTTYLIKMGKNESGTKIVSPLYTPPEQEFTGLCFPQSDFFALGRTFVSLLTGNNPEDFAKNTLKDEFQSLAKLINYMIEEYPGKRPQNTSIILQYLDAIEQEKNENINQILELIKHQNYWHYFFLIQKQKFLLNTIPIATFLVVTSLILSLLSPQISRQLNESGLQAFNQSNYNSALWQYRLALFFNNKSVSAHHNLGLIYDNQEQLGSAKNEYKKAIDIGNLDKSYNNLARLEILTGNYNQAITLIETSLKINPNSEIKTKHNLYKNLGWSQLKSGQLSAAKQSLKQAINLNLNLAPPYCLMAQVLEAEQESAQEKWQKCLTYSAPDDQPEIKEWQELAKQKVKQ